MCLVGLEIVHDSIQDEHELSKNLREDQKSQLEIAETHRTMSF